MNSRSASSSDITQPLDAPRKPTVDIIVLNWNGKEDTLECLRSLATIRYPYVRLIVVDNGSEDGSVATIAAEFPEITMVCTGRNLGYAGGNNAGISYCLDHAPADFFLLLNNDTVVDPAMLDHLVVAAASRPDVGIFGPVIYYAQDPDILWFAGALWDDQTLAFKHCGLGEKRTPSCAGENFDYVTGCALMVRREVVEAVGLLDERFFLTYEEVDFCYRARDAGFTCAVVDEARIWHKVSASFGGDGSPLLDYFMTRNRLMFGRKHFPLITRLRLLVRVASEVLFPQLLSYPARNVALLRRIYWLLRQRRLLKISDYQNTFWRARFRGLRDYLFSRYGDSPQYIRRLSDEWRSMNVPAPLLVG